MNKTNRHTTPLDHSQEAKRAGRKGSCWQESQGGRAAKKRVRDRSHQAQVLHDLEAQGLDIRPLGSKS